MLATQVQQAQAQQQHPLSSANSTHHPQQLQQLPQQHPPHLHGAPAPARPRNHSHNNGHPQQQHPPAPPPSATRQQSSPALILPTGGGVGYHPTFIHPGLLLPATTHHPPAMINNLYSFGTSPLPSPLYAPLPPHLGPHHHQPYAHHRLSAPPTPINTSGSSSDQQEQLHPQHHQQHQHQHQQQHSHQIISFQSPFANTQIHHHPVPPPLASSSSSSSSNTPTSSSHSSSGLNPSSAPVLLYPHHLLHHHVQASGLNLGHPLHFPLRSPHSAPSSVNPSPPLSASFAPPSPSSASQMHHSHRHLSRATDAPLASLPQARPPGFHPHHPAPRSASVSGQSLPRPVPRPRTGSTHSDRSRPYSHHGTVTLQSLIDSTSTMAPSARRHAPASDARPASLRSRADSSSSASHSALSPHGFNPGSGGPSVRPSVSTPAATSDPYRRPSNITNSSSHPSRSSTPTSLSTSHPSPVPKPSRSPSPAQQQQQQAHPRPNPANSTSALPPAPCAPPTSIAQQHHLPPNPGPLPAPMLRRPSPLSQTSSHHSSQSDSRQNASYRLSYASTNTTSTAHPPGASTSPSIRHSVTPPGDEQEEDGTASSETASDPDHRQPGHRSTPGTSVDSTTSNSAQPQSTTNPLNPARPPSGKTADQPSAATKKNPKINLGHKFRRALNLGSLHSENLMHGSIPESGPPPDVQDRLKSSSASIAGADLPIGATAQTGNAPPQSGRRFGFLNPRANSSTDNLSISSTVSSASVMIRKLGNMGRTARRNSVMGLTKMFKDKKENTLAQSAGANGRPSDDKIQSSKRSVVQAQKNTPSTSVAQVTAEVDRSLSVEFPGMTPAAAFIHQQKQQYAEQEAAAAKAAAAAASQRSRTGSESSKSKYPTNSPVNSTGSNAAEARKKMIEKEKEKIKNKKGRKWGFGTVGAARSPVSPVVDEVQTLEVASEAEDGEEWDDRTVRGAAIEAELGPLIGVTEPSEELEERLKAEGGTKTLEESMDEYDAESLFGPVGENEGGGVNGQPKLRVRPHKTAVPTKSILKNAQNFSQDDYLSCGEDARDGNTNKPASGSVKSKAAAAHKKAVFKNVDEEETTAAFVIELGETPDLRLKTSLLPKRRLTFAQQLSVHSTWPGGIYDRRGELATCNRLTPTLAQRIKEELNAFKMEEMEVHFDSRIHTHFFVVS